MTISVTIPFIDEALGHSVIYEEYKGNFTQAQAIAAKRLAEARKPGTTLDIRHALLARGIVHLLQGETQPALQCFDELVGLAEAQSELWVRAMNYKDLVTRLHYDFFPGQIDAAAPYELQAIWNKFDYLSQINSQREQGGRLWEGLADDNLQLELLLTKYILNLLPNNRSTTSDLVLLHKDNDHKLLGSVLGSFPLKFHTEAKAIGAPTSLLAYALLAAADCAGRARHLERAQQHVHEAIALYREAGDNVGHGVCLMLQGDWNVAPFSSPEIWGHALQEGLSSNRLSTEEVYEFDRSGIDVATAKAAYQQAEALFDQDQSIRGLGALHLRYTYLAVLQDQYEAAMQHSQSAQRAFEATGDVLGFWTARIHQALAAIGAGHMPEDRDTASAVGTWGQQQGSFSYTFGLGLLCARVGRRWLIVNGDYERALACFRLAEALFRALGAPVNTVNTLIDQGELFRLIGGYTASLSVYETALTLCADALNQQSPTTDLLWSRGVNIVYALQRLHSDRRDGAGLKQIGQYALAFLVSRLPQDEAIRERVHQLWMYLTDQVPMTVENAELAARYRSDLVVRVLALLREESRMNHVDSYTYLFTVLNIVLVDVPFYQGREARDNGDEAAAQTLFDQAMAVARHSDLAFTNLLEGMILAQQRRYDEAAHTIQRQLDYGRQSAANLAPGQDSVIMNEMRQRSEAQALQVAFSSYKNVKAFVPAETHLNALEDLMGTNWWQQDDKPWEPLLDVGELYEGLQQPQRALHVYDQALTLFEARRVQVTRDDLKTGLAAQAPTQSLYFNAARACLTLLTDLDPAHAPAYLAKAFSYAERGKARALLDLVATSAVVTNTAASESQAITAWRHLTARLITRQALLAQLRLDTHAAQPHLQALEQHIAADQLALRQAERELAQTNPAFYRTINPQAQVITLEQLSALLTDTTVLLQYLFLNDAFLAWAITRTGMVHTYQHSVDTQTLKRHIRQLHHACAHGMLLPDSTLELTDLFLTPFATILADYHHLIIVPYGAAHTLPFHALPWHGQPLGTTHTISYLPSASVLPFVHQHTEFDGHMLVVGNPSQMAVHPPLQSVPHPLPPLPAAELEARLVAATLPHTTLLLGDAATLDTVRAAVPHARLLHFATHGYLSAEAPLSSSIVLANGDSLTVYDLMGLHLQADLVVVSACDTGRGETTGGDDVLGLTRGLLAAGAKAVVVSLWPVDDLSTALLMQHFYQRLRDGSSPAVALQQAQTYLRTLTAEQIALARQSIHHHVPTPRFGGTADMGMVDHGTYSHPYYWAPFILVGVIA